MWTQRWKTLGEESGDRCCVGGCCGQRMCGCDRQYVEVVAVDMRVRGGERSSAQWLDKRW